MHVPFHKSVIIVVMMKAKNLEILKARVFSAIGVIKAIKRERRLGNEEFDGRYFGVLLLF